MTRSIFSTDPLKKQAGGPASDAAPAPSRIRLAILLQDLEFGGTQQYAIGLLRNLDQRLFAPELWVMRGGLDMAEQALATGVQVKWLTRTRKVGPRSVLALLFWLVWNRPEMLYTLTVVPNIWGRIFGRLVRVPNIVSGYRNLNPKQHERWLWRFSDRIVCNATVLKETMIRQAKVSPQKISVIANAVDPEYFDADTRCPSPQPTVLFLGRLVWEKSPETMIQAFAQVLSSIPGGKLKMVGNGPFKDRLANLVRELGLEEGVALLPGTVDIRPYLREAWVFALPSATEASPNVILEAMSMGLPIVATGVGGIPELVENGGNGFLVKPQDPASLAEALIRLLQDDRLRQEMGQKSRQRVLDHHTPRKIAKKTEAVLLEVAGRTTG